MTATQPSAPGGQLNLEQHQAATSGQRHLLVVAGPGTGKTLTIVHRIAHLVRTGTRPERILAATFTNRAAREMKARTDALLGPRADGVFIGTLHLLGLRMLRELSGGDFTLFGREEQERLLKPLVGDSSKKARDAADMISLIKNGLQEAAPDFKPVFEAYQAALVQQGACDFDDLIVRPVELLRDPALAGRFRDRFDHIIIDEYQDINPAQYRLLRLVAGETSSICAVGDSDQAIYSFRGADIRSFLGFEKDFPAAARITLVRNYRSTGTILRAAEGVVGKNQKRIAKKVVPAGEPGAPVLVYSVPDERAEAAAIIDEIELRMGGMSHESAGRSSRDHDQHRSCRFSDFAVLYRTNAQARSLEAAFAASGIPFQVIGKPGGTQRKEAEEMIAFLRSLARIEGGEQPGRRPGNAESLLLTEADFFDPRADAVALMTMHAAKGLEFPVVFLTGCEDGLMPCTVMKEAADPEEERRLLYVGMTRAREQLFLLHARHRFLFGQSLGQKPSPFLKDIPDDVKEHRNIAERVKKEKPEDNQLGLF